MDVLNGILDEALFEHISDDGLKAFGALLNDKLSARVLAYVNSPEGNPLVKKRIMDKLGVILHASVFHEEVHARNLVSLVELLTFDVLPTGHFDIPQVIKQLTWLESNRHLLRANIAPRKKADYEAFVREACSTKYPAGCQHYTNLRQRIEANKTMFYAPNERPRATGLSMLVRNADTWVMALKGLRYRQYCDTLGFTPGAPLRKEF